MSRICGAAMAAMMIMAASVPQPAAAGTVVDKGDAFWWVTDVALGAPNNDDFMGQFADNPNKVWINRFNNPPDRPRQRVDAIERTVPTAASSGVTEYGLTLGANSPALSDDNVFPIQLNNRYIIELGFGTGDSFVRAGQVAPQLRFDPPETVSPPIVDYKPIPIATLPALEVIEHRGDALLLQGRYDLGNFRISSFGAASLFVLPLDIPDLPLSARAYYTADELAGLSDSEVPFTIRMHIVPEPAARTLAMFGLMGLALAATSRSRQQGRCVTPPRDLAENRASVQSPQQRGG